MPKGLTTGIIFIPLDVRWPRSKKVRALIVRHGLDGMAAWALYLAMACYCRENLSDGFVPADEIGALAYPLPGDQAGGLLKLLTDHRLVIDARHSERQGDRQGERQGERDDDRHSEGYLVRAYVKRNGTRVDTLRYADEQAERGRAGARSRWSQADNGDRHSGAPWRPLNQTESETESETSSRARAPARGRAGEAASHDDDDSVNTILAMLHAHGPITREQAAAYLTAVTAGRNLDDPARYAIAAIRKDPRAAWREATTATARRATGQPPRAGSICPRCGKTDHPAGQCPTLGTQTSRADLDSVAAEGGAATARKLMANRERPAQAEPARPPELHGEALARHQAEEARAARLVADRLGGTAVPEDQADEADEADADAEIPY